MLRLMKKTIRAEILKKVEDEPLKYKGSKIVVLKQVPTRHTETVQIPDRAVD